MTDHSPARTESIGLYPGLVVCDARCCGSITIGRTRLPIWAVTADAIHNGWDAVEADYYPEQPHPEYDFHANDFAAFIHNLLEHRDDLGRLLLVLADAERCGHQGAWMRTKRHPKRIAKALRAALAEVEALYA